MGLWNKIFTLFRGAATEAGQAVVDKNAIRILEQEIRDASEALRKSREDLTKMMAQRKLAWDKLSPKQAKVQEYGGYIEQLLGRGDEALAMEVAEKLAALEADMVQEAQLIQQYDANAVLARFKAKAPTALPAPEALRQLPASVPDHERQG